MGFRYCDTPYIPVVVLFNLVIMRELYTFFWNYLVLNTMILYRLSIGIICSSFLLALRIELLVDKLTSSVP